MFSDLVSAWERSRETFGPQALLFLSLTLRALGLALLAGLPAGVALTRLPRVAGPVVAGLGLLQTVPSLVLLGLLIPVLGVGQASALFAAVVASLFPIVAATYVGITGVAPAVRDAARGMGMTDRQVLWHVALPLAFPVLLTGVRNAAVYATGMIVTGALIGAGGLGDYIYNGMSRADRGLIWLGTLPVLAVTLALFWGLGALAGLARRNSALGLAVGGGLILALAGYAGYEAAARAVGPPPDRLRVGAKDFTEGQILAEIVKQTAEAHAGVEADIYGNLGTSLILQALRTDELDVYPEYTGVLLTSKDALDRPVPADRASITAVVRDGMRERFDLALLEPFGLNNTYAPCVTRATAAKYRLQTVGDLQRTPDLRVVIDLSFLTRPDGWPGLVAHYDLRFRRPPVQVSPNLLYKALEQGEADVVIGFATDWQIAALDLVALADDRGYFPSYHAAPLVREAALRRYPKLRPALERLAGRLDDRTMRRLNYQVAVERRSEADVARAFLREIGLLDRAE